MAFRWQADNGPLLVVFRSSLPQQNKQSLVSDELFWSSGGISLSHSLVSDELFWSSGGISLSISLVSDKLLVSSGGISLSHSLVSDELFWSSGGISFPTTMHMKNLLIQIKLQCSLSDWLIYLFSLLLLIYEPAHIRSESNSYDIW